MQCCGGVKNQDSPHPPLLQTIRKAVTAMIVKRTTASPRAMPTIAPRDKTAPPGSPRIETQPTWQ